MTERERLIELIRQGYSKGRAREEWDLVENTMADYLLEKGVVVFPCKVGDIIDKVISHNAIVAIWLESKHYSDLLWKGMAHKIPQKYKLMPFKRIFGIIPETIDESDTVNILVEAQKALERRKDNE